MEDILFTILEICAEFIELEDILSLLSVNRKFRTKYKEIITVDYLDALYEKELTETSFIINAFNKADNLKITVLTNALSQFFSFNVGDLNICLAIYYVIYLNNLNNFRGINYGIINLYEYSKRYLFHLPHKLQAAIIRNNCIISISIDIELILKTNGSVDLYYNIPTKSLYFQNIKKSNLKIIITCIVIQNLIDVKSYNFNHVIKNHKVIKKLLREYNIRNNKELLINCLENIENIIINFNCDYIKIITEIIFKVFNILNIRPRF